MYNRNFQQLKISIHQIEMKWKKKKKKAASRLVGSMKSNFIVFNRKTLPALVQRERVCATRV